MFKQRLANVRLIFRRELRDQLRDRRTLFMIAVLPVLFYPLLGVSFFQIAQFLRDHPSKILIIGHEPTVSSLPSLIDNDRFSNEVFGQENTSLVELSFLPLRALRFVNNGRWPESGRLTEKLRSELNIELRQLMLAKNCEAAVCFPPNFFQQLEEYPLRLREHSQRAGTTTEPPPEVPRPEVLFDNSNDKTVLAHGRVDRALKNWSEQVGRKSLEEINLPSSANDPIGYNQSLVAREEERINTSLWSKVLPFVLMIWAVTGAFYPAVDLCAGEKERGTLETLLSSPARRGEIVMGKLLTVMLFSMATAVLNLVSMGITGAIVMKQLGSLPTMADVGPPPFMAMIWLSLILIPVSALFSAVCLALAAFARSTKEGQYYLMPVILVTMPLILLPMHPGAELNLGFSLIPVSGIVLLMRSTMEGTFGDLWPYTIPVAAVTFACCWLAVRWAVDQFRSEDVLFREGEQWDVGMWVRHLLRDRGPTPTAALAVLCGVLILIIRFFMTSTMGGVSSLAELQRIDVMVFLRQQTVFLLVTVFAPAMIMTFLLTRSPRETLQLKRPPLLSLPAAALLAIALMPMIVALSAGVNSIYEPSAGVESMMVALDAKLDGADLVWVLLVIAAVPAICEELAYRGFILSGFRHTGYKWRAIGLSSLFFAITHPFVPQQINAFLLGLVLGYIAIQSGSIWPAMTYHLVHNGVFYWASRNGLLAQIADNDLYAGVSLFGGTMIAVTLFFWFHEMHYHRTKEETLQEAIDRESAKSLAG